MRSRAVLLGSMLLLACSGGEADAPVVPDAAELTRSLIEDGPHQTVTLALGELGEIEIELLPELAPETVHNFLQLAEAGFFTGTTFHRVIPGFMVQGGCPNTKNLDPRDDGDGSPGYEIRDEFSEMPHLRGVVSMANDGSRNAAGSQFFIVQEDSRHLDGRYSAFGRVVSGMEVVDAITKLELDTYGRYGPPNRPYPVDARVSEVRLREPREDGVQEHVATR